MKAPPDDNPTRQVFLLSPAHCGGERAQLLTSPRGKSELAQRLRAGSVPVGELFAFISGLYFRGKLTYATAFARPSSAVLVITADRGLIPVATPVTLADMEQFAKVNIHEDDPRYRAPMERDLFKMKAVLGATDQVVLLGSVATGKYVEVLLQQLGERLLFPIDFVGRGDMSRGGLLLRSAREGNELPYVPVVSAVRHGKRPPKLPKLRNKT